MKFDIPSQDVPLQNENGIDPIWYQRLKAMSDFCKLFDQVNVKTLTNGQVLIWNATLKKFLPGAN
jgi:hypothetical protein